MTLSTFADKRRQLTLRKRIMSGASQARKNPHEGKRPMTGLHIFLSYHQPGCGTPRAETLRNSGSLEQNLRKSRSPSRNLEKSRCIERNVWPSRIRPG